MKRNMKRVKLFLMLMLLTVMSVESWGTNLSIDTSGGGTGCDADLSTYNATGGQTVTITITLCDGYRVASVEAYDWQEWADVTVSGSGLVRTFTMPANEYYVSVTVTFEEVDEEYIEYHTPTCVTSPSGIVQTTTYATATPTITGYTFEGWTTNGSYTNSATKPTGLDSRRPGSTVVTTEEVYAVYSYYTGTPASETFDVCGGAISAGYYVFSTNKSGDDCNAIGNNVSYNKITPVSIAGSNTTATMSPSQREAVWQVEASGTYWTFKNMENGKYLAATGTNNQLVLVNSITDDYAKWNVAVVNAGNNTYRIWNKQNSSSAIKYYTSSGSKVFASSDSGTSGNESILYLFKKTTAPGFGQTTNYTINPTCPGLSVTYVGGSGATGSVTDGNTYEFEDEVTIKSNTGPGFTKEGYNFLGWTCDYRLETEDGDPYEYLIGETIPAGEVVIMPAASITLTAVWEEKTYLYGSSCEPLENITVTYNDAGTIWTRDYGVGTPVTVDSEVGSKGCAEWTFVGWQRGSAVANNSTSYTPVHNFTATAGDDDAVFYAVYDSVGTDWISAYNISELHGGAEYVIVRPATKHYVLTDTVASTNYLKASELASTCIRETEAGTPTKDRYKLAVTAKAGFKWEIIPDGNYYALYNREAGKYLKLTSDGYALLTNTPEDKFTLANGDNDSEITLTSYNASPKYLYKSSAAYFSAGTSETAQKQYLLTNAKKFTSTPSCGARSVRFEGNGGTVIAYGGSPTGAYLDITEASRGAGITTPTATFAVCNGKSWSFVGWSDKEIDVTRVPILTTDLLNDGGGNKHHDITSDGERYYAVFTNQGSPETKYGTISITDADVEGEYRAAITFTKTVTEMGDYTFEYYRVGNQSGLGIQFDYDNATRGYIKNTTSLGKINSISFSSFGTGSISDIQVYVGNSSDACNTLLTAAELQTVSGVSTYYPKNNYAYVKIQATAYVGVGTISIDFGKGTQVWATTPDCSTITLSGTPRITSYAGKTVKGVTALTVNAKQLKASTPLSFAAYNVADDTPNSHFGFVGSVSALADGTVTAQTIIVTYTPDAGATTDGIEEVYFKATALADDEVTTTESNKQSGYGRHLPTKFVIATKVGDDWYALPNNISGYGNPAAVKLSSVNEGTGVATYYSDQYDGEAVGSKNYLTWTLNSVVSGSEADYGYTNHGNRVRFYDSKNSKYLEFGTGDNVGKIQNNRTTSNPASVLHIASELLPTTSDLIDYTLLNEGQTKYLGVDGSKLWGAYAGSTTVRFLIPNQQPAPDITWYNDMLDAEHTSNKAENGVVTLPTGENPEACSAAGDLLTFDGWVTTTWDGYKTTGFTKVNNGDAVTSNKTYYAVFKTSDNKYFTKCPTIQTVTYTANGGTGSDVVESYAMVSSSGTAVTLKDVGTGDGQINFTKEGYVFVGWTTSSNYGGEFTYAGNSVTVKPEDSGNYGNLTLSAVWVGALTITGDVHLTSTYTSVARSEANTVYTTANPNNLLTVSVAGVPTAIASKLKIRTSYLTSADETQAAATCPFRLCNDGSSNYNIVDGGNLNITSDDYSQTYAIGYKPSVDGGASGTTETYKLKLELINSNGDKVFSTAIKELYGRVLPTHFVIAAKINGQWCALPADIATSSGSAIANAYPITVNDQTTPTVATSAPKAALYSGTVRAHNDHRGGVRLVTATGDVYDGQLQATRSDNAYLWRTTSDCTTGMQEWYLVSNNFSTYEVRLDPTIKRSSSDAEDGGDGAAYVTRQLCVNGNQILFGTTSAKTMYILPVTNEYEPVEMQVVEWKADGIKFMYFGNPEYTAEVEIEGVNKASAAALGSALRVDVGVYEIAVSGLKGSAYKQMNIIIKNGATEVGRKAVTIPLIVNTETTIESARSTAGITVKANCSNVDLVVLNGGKLSSSETTDASQFTFKSITVYGGGKLIVPAGNYLTAKKMYLRAGSVTATTKGATPATSYSYVYPQVYVGSGSTLTINENIINFDYLTNYDQYFGVAFPHTAAINKNNITYPDDIYGSAAKTGSYLLRVFDSQIRATQGATDNVWVDVETGSEAMPKQTNTVRGLGYYALFPPRKVSVNGGDAERQKYGIQRVKMSAESLSNENANATIEVTAYSAEQPYNAGWWMLGNPYMANLNGGGVGDSKAAIRVGKIGKNAQGQYEWQDKEVRYVTVPNDDASETYNQRPVSSYTFPAFKPFYVQVGTTGTVTFTTTSRVNAAPSRFFNNEMPAEIETAIALNSEAYGDTTHILINNEFTSEYEVGDDLLKMPHANVSLFTISGTTDLFANALNVQSAAEGIPVGYTAPTEGQYTFSYNDKLSTAWIEHLWLIDYVQNSTIDLLESDYTFNTTAETNKTRFVLKIELKSGKEDPTTSIDGLIETSPNEGPIKFIYQDKLYIRYNGIIYDAVGKKVK